MNLEYEFIVATHAIFIFRGALEKVVGHFYPLVANAFNFVFFRMITNPTYTVWNNLSAEKGLAKPQRC